MVEEIEELEKEADAKLTEIENFILRLKETRVSAESLQKNTKQLTKAEQMTMNARIKSAKRDFRHREQSLSAIAEKCKTVLKFIKKVT